MSFVHFKMALARLTIIICVILYKQGIHGQQSGFMSAPAVGQNTLDQIQSNQGTTQKKSIQNHNGNLVNKATNLNAQVPVHFQSLNPQAPISTQSTLSLQQPQKTEQNFQQTFTVQPSLQFDASFLQSSQQSSGLQQQQNLPQSQNVYRVPVIQQIPCMKQLNAQHSANVGDFNEQKQLSPVAKPNPVPSLQVIPNTSFITSSPSVSSCPCHGAGNINNLGANYFPTTANAYSIIEPPHISTPYSTLPVMAVLSRPTPISQVTRSVLPYGNQDIRESPLRISNKFFIEDETNDLNQDNLTTLLLSLLQSPKKSSSSAIPTGYSGIPYLSSYLNQVSKPSTIKSLLPLILNILTERKEGCGCRGCQNCEQKNKNKDAAPRIYDGYSKKRDYSVREEIFQKDPGEEIPTMVREHKKSKKLKNLIPVDICEDEDTDYSDCSEEDEN